MHKNKTEDYDHILCSGTFIKKESRFYKIFKKTYIHFLKKYLKKYNKLNYIILYNKYKNQYKKNEINKMFKQVDSDEHVIEEIIEEYEFLREVREIMW